MDIIETELPGVMVLIPRRFGDERGWFSETWNARTLAHHGITTAFVQDNQSFSAEAGTLRGLHYQAPPHAQAKLVRCLSGRILDVAVDARAGSPTYGRWAARELTAEGGEQLLVPEGFLHGFLTLTPDAMVAYKCSDYYAPEADGAVRWDSVGIDWGLSGPPTLSLKDAEAPAFDAWESPFAWGEP
ncbi:dTDP-4-dehydrorhamnose 3,5-epimerase [Rhodovulum sp. 12E13]|uniref:dTDP-4-dehydrorhamnose 3,5-epimerase n=1 Tax=Rhodovulum sp. 12E13 TaxID=2203891 RepID=UPI000E13AC98|nr:dTDP-4-dehydrorhamnose 3,5-epimerase [Rhodovulum sp. 12E13]RDC74043.1 dTDP-4-dehydrorhamnose 3,5-epimerase [Rhodovulum sp. 12E13]